MTYYSLDTFVEHFGCSIFIYIAIIIFYPHIAFDSEVLILKLIVSLVFEMKVCENFV